MVLFNHSAHVPSTRVCMQEYLLLFISLDVVSHWPQIKDSNRLPCCAPLWRVASTKYDAVPWPPLALVLRLYNFQNCHCICFKWNKCIHSFIFYYLAKQVALANQCIYFFLWGRRYCKAHCFSWFEGEWIKAKVFDTR